MTPSTPSQKGVVLLGRSASVYLPFIFETAAQRKEKSGQREEEEKKSKKRLQTWPRLVAVLSLSVNSGKSVHPHLPYFLEPLRHHTGFYSHGDKGVGGRGYKSLGVGVLGQKKGEQVFPLRWLRFRGPAQRRDRHRVFGIRGHIAAVVDEEGHPGLGPEIGVFLGVPLGRQSKLSQIRGGGKGHEAEIGLALRLAGG